MRKKIIENRPNGTKRVYWTSELPSKTDPSFLKDTDVNNIMSKYLKTGQMTHLAKRQGVYADVSEIPDLHASMIQVTKAQEAFNDLPAHLRERFQNSPVEMVKFLQNADNDNEAIKLGLKVRKETGPDQDPAGNKPVGRVSPKNTNSPKNQKNIKPNDDDSNDDDKA